MNNEAGYFQAVQNMAYRISVFSERDFDPLYEIYGDDQESMLAHFHANGDPQHVKEWDDLERVSLVVCTTYDVEYSAFMKDVWNYMVYMVISEPELSH